ncbi:MAG: GlcG/HbpS family heme-binding protein [Acidimicrobiales bacterium]
MSDLVTSVPQLTAAAARRLVDAAVARADELGVAVVVHVADAGGAPLALHRMDGAPVFSVTVAAKKAWTAVAAGARTAELREAFMADPVLLHALAPKIDEVMAVGGATPVVVDGRVAGAVGVSGATEEQDQDCADRAVADLG